MSSNSKIANVFSIIAVIDNARWLQDDNGQRLVNYHINPENISCEVEKAEYIILSHWLTYICDRQMQYQKIWDKGGYVLSALVKKYQECSISDLRKVLMNSIRFYENDGERKCCFISEKGTCDEALRRANFTMNEPEFAPRFPALEGISIVNTLVTLKRNGGLQGYLRKILKSDLFKENKQDAMIILLFAMYKLSYENILTNELENKLKGFDIFQNDTRHLDFNKDDYRNYSKVKIFESKRVNCAIRDYFKKKEYTEHFERLIDSDCFELLRSQLCQIELPGDVWNNNARFGKCLKMLGIKHGKNTLNRALRNLYNNSFDGYPEQFDVTFDFTPYMCEGRDERNTDGTPESKCNICLFKFLQNDDGFNYHKFIVHCNNVDSNCGLLKEYCKYNVPCKPDGDTCLKSLYKKMT